MSSVLPVALRRAPRRTLALATGVGMFCAVTSIVGVAPVHAAPIGQPAAPFPTECRSGSTLTLGEVVPIVAGALKQRAPGAAPAIDSAATQFSAQLRNATVSTLVITERGSEVSPGQGVQATHGANALTQRVLSIRNGTYRDGYKLSSISLNDAIETALVGIEANDALVLGNIAVVLDKVASSAVSSAVGVPVVGDIAGDIAGAVVKEVVELPGTVAEKGGTAIADSADSTCLAAGDGTTPITRETVKNAFAVNVSPELTAFAKSLTLSSRDCRPLSALSLDEAVAYVGATHESTLPKPERASYAASVTTVRANLRKLYISNAFVPKDEDELSAVFEKVASLPVIGGPGLTYVAGVLQNVSAGGELTHYIPLSDVSVNAVFNGARAINDITTFNSGPEYGLASAQGAAKALCRISDEGKPYPGADETVYTPNPLSAKPATTHSSTSVHGSASAHRTRHTAK
ncbi:hypothetical protein GCM10027169_25260 [Gordonia jinhuaensis]|uniref:Uncharacterized protein n=1 Tax=Gordonia jinhuaensis TaxID=1517702 RepID=A0A916TED5_9ACTN|nr:hypothetical protein [Gordonia jinhuaensis]GGB39398.1 hypothetical protein GCM10011489_28860 [Gordonia jinhuaensis]